MDLRSAYNLFQQGVLALARAEKQGIRVDMDRAEKQHRKLTNSIDRLVSEFEKSKFYRHWAHSRGGRTPNLQSGLQLGKFLYEVKKIKPLKKTAKGGPSTDEEALEALNIPELDQLIRFRKLVKLRDTYLAAFLNESVDGFIHPFFNLHTARTYRSSSDRPNFQNIPVRDKEAKKIVRGCLFPRKGHQLLEVDFGALEVCIAACYHKDPTMIKYIKDPSSDMHTDMAKQIFLLDGFDKSIPSHRVLRSGAKNGFVFPQFYGDYYGNNLVGLSKWAELPLTGWYTEGKGIVLEEGRTVGGHLRNKGIKGAPDFKEHLRKIEAHFWNKRFPVYNKWKERWWKAYQKKGYFDLYTGFRCQGVFGKNDVINYPVQGAAFHCLLWSFIRLDEIMRKEGWKTKLIGQIHDSILLDVHPSELSHVLGKVKSVTEVELRKHWKWINVPLKIEAELSGVDESWNDKKEINFDDYLK